MKRKLGWWFVLSPVIVGALWFLVSLVFRLITTVGDVSPLLDVIKTFINRGLGIVALLSIPLLILGIIFLATSSKDDSKTFTVKEIIRYSRTAAKKNMKFFLLGFVIYIALQFISLTFGYSAEVGNNQLRNIGITLLVLFVALRMKLGFANLSLNIVHNVKAKSDDVFVDFQRYIRYLGAYAIMYIIVVIGTLLLIVPGIIFALRLYMIPYLIIDKKLGSLQAIKTSWKMTKGFGGTIFRLVLLCGLINMLGILVIFVGLLRTLPLFMIANAYIYTKILAGQKK